MAFSVDDLKKLASTRPPSVTLTKDQLGVAGAGAFFDKVGGELTIKKPVVDVDARTIEGLGTLPGGSACPFQVRFVQAGSTTFVGLMLAAAVPLDELKKTFPNLALDTLRMLGFDAAVRIIAAVPDEKQQTQVVDEAGLRFSVRDAERRWRTLTFLVNKTSDGEHVITGDFGSEGLGLRDLSALTGLPGMAGVRGSQLELPPELITVWDRLPSLTKVRVALGAGGVRWVWAKMRLLDDWSTKYFKLSDVHAEVSVGPPPDGMAARGDRTVSVELFGTATIQEAKCSVRIDVPSLAVTAMLSKEASRKAVGEHLKDGDLPGGDPDVMLRWDIRDGRFLFLGHLGGPWSAGGVLSVTDIVCAVSGGYGQPLQARFVGRLAVGRTTIGLAAAKAPGSVTVGGTLDRLDLTDLDAWSNSSYGSRTPAVIAGLSLRRVAANLAIVGDQRRFDLTGTLELSLANGIRGSLLLALSIDKKKSESRGTAEFHGTLVLSAPRPIGDRTTMELDVTFNSDPTVKTLTAAWTTKDKRGLLDALGPFLGPNLTLPSTVVTALDVTAVKVHYAAPAAVNAPATLAVVAGDDRKWKASLALY